MPPLTTCVATPSRASASPRGVDAAAAVPAAATSRRAAIAGVAGVVFAAVSTRPAAAATATASSPPSTSGGDWSSPGLASPPRDPASPEFFRTDSGTAVQEVTPGDAASPAAADGDTLDVDFVLRRANGYFIYANVEGVSFQPADVPTGPFLFKLGDPAVLPGFSDAVRGMRPGGRRRALVPPAAGYKAFPGGLPQAPTFATKRQVVNHSGEPLLFEIALRKVRKGG